MQTGRIVQQAGTASEGKPDNKAQLARHLAQQPPSRRTFDRFMKLLEIAGLALVAGHLAWAIYASATWVGVPERIVAVWFALPVSVVAVMIVVGLHAAGLGAFFPIALPGGPQELITGSKAVGMGLGFAVVSLVVGAFWGAFAWAVWTTNWAILEPLISIIALVAGVGAVVAIASDLHKKLMQAR
jgi:hypothetical protein